MRTKLLVIFLVLFLFAGCSSTYQLRYRGEPNETRKYQLDVNMEQNMQMMGSEINMTFQLANFITQKIHKINNDGSLDVSIVYDSLRFDGSGPQIDMVKEMLKARLDSLEGLELNFKLSNQGKILESAKIDSLVPQQLQQLFNSRQTVSAFSPKLPEDKVKIGDTWEDEEITPVDMNKTKLTVTHKTKYTFVGLQEVADQKMLKISYTGTVSIEGDMEQQGMKMFMEGDGETKGDFLFDEKKGVYCSGVGETEMDMTIALTGGQNMTIPMTQIMKIKVSSGK